MNCKHQETLAYTLTSKDLRNLTACLKDVITLDDNKHRSLSFLTPSLRTARAKSVVATKSSNTITSDSLTTATRPMELETDECDQRSAERGRKPRKEAIVLPKQLKNCKFCGAMYYNSRKRIIDGIYKMGIKFQQARETIHLAIEIIDQYYLRMSQLQKSSVFNEKFMLPRHVLLNQVTSLLIASKYDEVDDNITSIIDLRTYIVQQLQQLGKKDLDLVPTFDQIVEAERRILAYFEWNLTFLQPLHFIRLQLANGILFSNELKLYEARLCIEDMLELKQELTRALTTEALSLSDLLISKGACLLRKERPSDIAAAVIYFARKNILFSDRAQKHIIVPTLWPEELILLTRNSEAQIRHLLSNPLEETYVVPASPKKKSAKPKDMSKQDISSASLEQTRSTNVKRQGIISPSHVTLGMQKEQNMTKTEEKPIGKFQLENCRILTKKTSSQPNLSEAIQHTEGSMEMETSNKDGNKFIAYGSVKESNKTQELNNSLENETYVKNNFQSQLIKASKESLRQRIDGKSEEDIHQVNESQPASANQNIEARTLPSNHQTVSQKVIGTIQTMAKKQPNGELKHYIPEKNSQHKPNAGGNERTRPFNSVDSVPNFDVSKDKNTKLPEIKTNNQNRLSFKHQNKQNNQSTNEKISEQHSLTRQREASQASIVSVSYAILSSSKRPHNPIGFQDKVTNEAQQQSDAYKATESNRQRSKKTTNSSQKYKKNQMSSRQKLNETQALINQKGFNGRKRNTQRQVCIPSKIISAQKLNEQVQGQQNSTRNNVMNRKCSNSSKFKNATIGIQSTIELPKVVANTPNSNDYQTLKSNRIGMGTKSQNNKNTVKEDCLSNSVDVQKSKNPDPNMLSGTNESLGQSNINMRSNQRLTDMVNNPSKPSLGSNNELISPQIQSNKIIDQLQHKENVSHGKSLNQKKQIKFRSSKNLISLANQASSSGNYLSNLPVRQTMKRLTTSQESLIGNKEADNSKKDFTSSQKLPAASQDLSDKMPKNLQKTFSAQCIQEMQIPFSSRQQFPNIAQQNSRETDRAKGSSIQDSVQYLCNISNSDKKQAQNANKSLENPIKIEHQDSLDPKNSVYNKFGSKNPQDSQKEIFKLKIPATGNQVPSQNSQRLVIRKSQNFQGLHNLMTPSFGEESLKSQTQNMHRILKKSFQVLPEQTTSRQQSKQNLRSSRDRQTTNQQNKNGKPVSLHQSQINMTQQLTQMQPVSTKNSKSGSFLISNAISRDPSTQPQSSSMTFSRSAIAHLDKSLIAALSSTAAQYKPFGDNLPQSQLTLARQNWVDIGCPIRKQGSINIQTCPKNSGINQQPADQRPQAQVRQMAIKNRNHQSHGGSNMMGIVPLHGLINANFSKIKTNESKGSFNSNKAFQINNKTPQIHDNFTADFQQRHSQTNITKVTSTSHQLAKNKSQQQRSSKNNHLRKETK